MYNPTARVLTVLEMLQARERVTGSEIAERLEVHIRSVRRYIKVLEELGIPVASERGRYGAYRFLPGFKLPPLMFTQEEALAVLLGLLTARKQGLTGAAPGCEGALAKLVRVLPPSIQNTLRAVEETLIVDLHAGGGRPDSETVIALSDAASRHQRVVLLYHAADGEESERAFDPYGLIYRRAAWYTVGYCHLRHGLRVFRLDRIRRATLGEEFFECPAGFDALEYVLQSLGSVPRNWPVEVLLQTTVEEARRWIIPEVGVLTAEGNGVVLRCYTDDISWLARLLLGLGCPLLVRSPPELRTEIKHLAGMILQSLEATV